jgi:hypothetical protein
LLSCDGVTEAIGGTVLRVAGPVPARTGATTWLGALHAADKLRAEFGCAATTAVLGPCQYGVRVMLPSGEMLHGTEDEARAALKEPDRAPFPVDDFEYKVVADRLAERIRSGEFGDSGRLPTTRALMDHYGVGMYVVNRARRELMQRGLVYSVPLQGTFTR